MAVYGEVKAAGRKGKCGDCLVVALLLDLRFLGPKRPTCRGSACGVRTRECVLPVSELLEGKEGVSPGVLAIANCCSRCQVPMPRIAAKN